MTTEVTQAPRAALKVGVEGPAAGAVGAPVAYKITASNPGTGPATGVMLNAKFDAALEHETKLNPVESKVGTLGPGESRAVALALTPRQAGELANVMTVRADGGLTDTARRTVAVKRAEVSLRNTGPAWRYVGRPADWSVELENRGEVPLANVVVRDALPPEVAFERASDGGTPQGNRVTWAVGALAPGEKRRLTVTTVCKALALSATVVATVTADPAIDARAATTLEIRGLPAVRMKVADRDDPVDVGKQTEYRIEVANRGALPEEEVRVSAVMRVLDATGPAAGKVEGQRVTFGPVGPLAPGQTVVYTIGVQAVKAAPAVYFRAELTTSTLTKPLVEEESTSVLPANGGAAPAEGPPGK